MVVARARAANGRELYGASLRPGLSWLRPSRLRADYKARRPQARRPGSTGRTRGWPNRSFRTSRATTVSDFSDRCTYMFAGSKPCRGISLF